MKNTSTMFLRIFVCLIGMIALLLFIFLAPKFAGWFAEDAKSITGIETFPLAIAYMYAPSVPFFFAIFQILNLLKFIDKGTAFSQLSVNALKLIKYCGIAMSIIYYLGMPFIFCSAEVEEAPGMVLIAGTFFAVPLVIAIFSEVLNCLLLQALDMKQEIDLTL